MFDQDKRDTAIRLSKSRCKALICLSVPQLHQGLQDRIGRDLRALYGQLLCEPIPDRLIDLVEQLDRAPRRSIQ